MNQSHFLAFCKKYGISPSYHPKDEEALRRKICASNFFIADDTCTHRMVGFYYKQGTIMNPEITIICTRIEMPLARKIALENRKKIYYDSKVSAFLFHKYRAGREIEPVDFLLLLPFYYKYFKYKGRMYS